MTHALDDTLALLARTPPALNALLRDLPEIWTLRNEGENTWTPVDVIGHLIVGERTDWIPRARLILQSSGVPTFEPFDMQGHAEIVKGKSLAQLLDEFARLRSKNLAELRAMQLTGQDLARPAQHPTLGPVNLSELLATWPAHDLTHLHQLTRILAHQYRAVVGPWSQYMGVMQCAGHSSR